VGIYGHYCLGQGPKEDSASSHAFSIPSLRAEDVFGDKVTVVKFMDASVQIYREQNLLAEF
jgi:hypothetical protein